MIMSGQMSVDKERYGHSTYYMESRMKTEGIETPTDTRYYFL